MILVIGDRHDPVISRLLAVLRADRLAHAALDTSTAHAPQLHAPGLHGPGAWRVTGGDCQGRRPVQAVFVRPGRSIPAARRRAAAALWTRIERMLLTTEGTVMNRLSAGAGNHAKVRQIQQLGAAGLGVPPTWVGNDPASALAFVLRHEGDVLSKGLSSIKTIPRAIGAADIAAIDGVRRCPVQLQRIVRGREMRLTVIGQRAIVSLPRRRAGFRHVDAAQRLPADLVSRCIGFVADQGLLLGGFDLCETSDGICFFEMNPTPLISHYDTDVAPTLTRAVIQCLLTHAPGAEGILV